MGLFIQPPFWAVGYGRANVAPHMTVTLVGSPAADPIDLATAKLYARLAPTDLSLDTILPGVITTMRRRVERDAGVLIGAATETYDVAFDAWPCDRTPIALPWRPVVSITSVKVYDSAGIGQTVDPSNYLLDPSSDAPTPARLGLTTSGAWPTDRRPFQPYVVRLVAGYATVDAIPKSLTHALGLLVAAYVNKDALGEYDDAIAGYRLVTVA
jgi:uncharacterized phiE125 gp8 family phage protein